MARIGVFGGTFDPPHIGHLILASEAAEQLDLDTVMWLLAPNPPHKQGQILTNFERRTELVQACIRDDARFSLSVIENERTGPHYTSDTLRILRKHFPSDTLILLIGGDSLNALHTWHRPDLVIKQADQIGVMLRSGEIPDWESLKITFPNLLPKISVINAPLLEISSSRIREQVRMRHPYRYYLSDAVFCEITAQNDYSED